MERADKEACVRLIGQKDDALGLGDVAAYVYGQWKEECNASFQPLGVASSCVWGGASLAYRCSTQTLFLCSSILHCLSTACVPPSFEKPTFCALLVLVFPRDMNHDKVNTRPGTNSHFENDLCAILIAPSCFKHFRETGVVRKLFEIALLMEVCRHPYFQSGAA